MVRQSVREGGLVATLFLPPASAPRAAVLALGGRGAAETFASEGFAALALAYLGLDGLPRELVEIPLGTSRGPSRG